MDGEIEQGTGELGFFSPHSWWPLYVGLAAAIAALGVAIGWWLFLIGLLALFLTVIGLFGLGLGSAPGGVVRALGLDRLGDFAMVAPN